MNIETLKPSEIKEFLSCCHEMKMPAYIIGWPGVGKSTLIEEFARSINANFPAPLILSTLLPIDVRGIGVPNKVTKRLDYYKVPFFPPTESTEKWVLFYDEMGNSDPKLQAVVQQLLLKREIGEYKLPANAFQVAAGNEMDDGCNTYQMSEALKDRMIFVRLLPDLAEWLEWGTNNGIDPSVLSFIHLKPEYLHYRLMSNFNFEDEDVKPTPRSWENVSKILKLEVKKSEKIENALIAGQIGVQAAATFVTVKKQMQKLPNILEFIKVAGKQPKKAAQMIPNDTISMWGLVFNLLPAVKDTKEASDTLLAMAEIDQSTLPVAEIVTIYIKHLVNKFSNVKDTVEFVKSPGKKAFEKLITTLNAYSK